MGSDVMRRKKRSFAAMTTAIFLFVFLVFGLNILRVLNTRKWVPETPFRILLIKNQATEFEVLSIWPGIQGPVLVSLPADVYVPAVGGYGNLRPEALLTLGKIDGVRERLLVDSLSITLASPIHESYEYSGEGLPGWKFKWKLIRQGLSGKRSLIEAIQMVQLLDKANANTIRRIELSEANVVRDRIEVDGSVQKYLEPALLDDLLLRERLTMWPAAADLQMAVINASNMSQMAAVWSKYARLNGYDVVSVTDIPGQNQATTLLFSSKDIMKSQLGRALMALYPMAKPEVADTRIYRADVALIIGLDSWQWLNQRGAYLSKNF